MTQVKNSNPDIIKERMYKSCLTECKEPVVGIVHGNLPKWLKGSVIRNGPGMFDVGPNKYNLMIDGMAIFQKYSFDNGSVTYKNKYLKGDTYKKNMAANRIVISEAGTLHHPDPCKNIFQRFFSWFTEDNETDNCNVNLVNFGDGIYAVTELSKIHRIDTDTLESIDKTRLRNYISAYTYTAHPQRDADGTVYNFGQSFGSRGPLYSLLKFPNEKGNETFEKASIVTQIPSRWRFNFGYYHSFGMTDRYIIFTEQSMQISLADILMDNIKNRPVSNCLKFNENDLVRFFVIDKTDGVVSDEIYTANPFFFFHSINAYEDDNQLVFDFASYKEIKAIESLKRFSDFSIEDYRRAMRGTKIERFVLPLNTQHKVNDNIISLDYTTATARLQPDGSVFCEPEVMDTKGYAFELPQINLAFNGKKYRYAYGISYESMSKRSTPTFNELMKYDYITKDFKLWRKEGYHPTEPLFVSEPESNSVDEDDGLILSAVYSLEQEKNAYLLVLDAKSFEEVAWCEFETNSGVPVCIHGKFFTN